MTSTSIVPLTAGHLSGRAFWDTPLQTFAAVLDVFEPTRPGRADYPPASVRIGTRVAEFVTPDSLLNHLAATGLPPDEATVAQFCRYGQLLADRHGEPEVVGLRFGLGRGGHVHRLFLQLPDGRLLPVNPRIAHPDHGHHWGDTGPATVATARVLCEIAFLRRPGPDVEAFAIALTYEFLGSAGPDFSLSANAVCDWFLTDTEPGTSLGPADLVDVRRRVSAFGPTI